MCVDYIYIYIYNKLNIDFFFFHLIQCFKSFHIKKTNILYFLWFNVSRLFLPHTYIQNSLYFINSPFSSPTLLLHYIPTHSFSYYHTSNIHNKKQCYLSSIFRQHLPCSNIIFQFNCNPYELSTTK